MTVSPQHLTTKSLSMGNLKQFPSGALHPRWVSNDSLLAAVATFPLGTLMLTGQIIKRGRKNEKYVECLCSKCNRLHLIYPANIRTGKTTNCKCQRGVKYGGDPRALLLGDRYDSIVQRCNNPSDENYKNYGGRGIELRFISREHFIRWSLENLRHVSYLGVEIDREDNNGHYEPGNLRLRESKTAWKLGS